jgi:hypothetical protein
MEPVDPPAGQIDVCEGAPLHHRGQLVLCVREQRLDQRTKTRPLDGCLGGAARDPRHRGHQPARIGHLADRRLHQECGDRLVLSRDHLQGRHHPGVFDDIVGRPAETARLGQQRAHLQRVEDDGQPLVGGVAADLGLQPPLHFPAHRRGRNLLAGAVQNLRHHRLECRDAHFAIGEARVYEFRRDIAIKPGPDRLGFATADRAGKDQGAGRVFDDHAVDEPEKRRASSGDAAGTARLGLAFGRLGISHGSSG